MNILGIDLGHCETAVATPKEMQGRYEVTRICPQQKDQIIVTQIVLTNEQMKALKGIKMPSFSVLSKLGEISIGNYLPMSVENGEKFIYFKVPPKDFDKVCANTEVGKSCGITHGMVMACYAYALTVNIFKYNVGDCDEINRTKTELLVGCPTTADWTSISAREKYAQLIKNATGVKSVQIIPESRAAMFSSVENGKNKVSAAKGALVFDFGSSTADCTYMLLGRKIFEFSWTLGASEIERRMVQIAYAGAQQSQRFAPDFSSFVRCENDLRTAKEFYYNGVYGRDGHDMICSFKTVDQKTKKQIITIDDDFMNRVVGEEEIHIKCDSTSPKSGTWISLCKEFFQTAKDALATNKTPIDTVVLTGGASKMGFIYDLCCSVFYELPKTHIILESNPSHTVANGLGWVAITDLRAKECKNRAKNELLKNDHCSISSLKNSIRESIYKLVCEIVTDESNKWAVLGGEHSAQELLDNIDKSTKSIKFKSSIENAMSSAIKAWKSNLSDAAGKAVNRQVKELYSGELSNSFILPQDIWKEISNVTLDNNKSISINGVLENIDITPLFNGIALIVLRIVLWGIAGALAIETFGISLAVAFLIDACLDDFLGNETIKKTIDKKRAQNSRQNIANKISQELSKPETKTKMLENMNSELDSYFKGYEAVVDNLLTNAFEIVTLKRFDNK